MKTISLSNATRRATFSQIGRRLALSLCAKGADEGKPERERGTAGFTLIELLIAIGIFSVFMTIITGVFTRFVKTERHAIAQGQVISDVTNTLEAFIKEARTGYGSTYYVDGNAIAFVNQSGECVAYRRERIPRTGALNRYEMQRGEEELTGSDTCTVSFVDSDRFTPITSSATSITTLTFVLPEDVIVNNGVLQNQGSITITLTAKSKTQNIPAITIQNSVTSRQMEPYTP